MDSIRNKVAWILILVLLVVWISACSANSPAENSSGAIVDKQSAAAVETSAADTSAEEEDTASQPLEGQVMEFAASDGTKLQGMYYPAGQAGAPLIILMHWAPGDQNDYVEIAYWLQNRGLGGSSENPDDLAWLDPSWFPEIETDKTYAVFTFNFRGCEGGCQSFDREGWLDDAQSAVEFAYELDGIDQQRVLVVGASIGADGAADGCLYLNEIFPGSCNGSFSISPGDYLTQSYAETIVNLNEGEEDAVPAWCLYAESDAESAGICSVLESGNFTAYQIGDGHGMKLVQPGVDPNPLDLLLAFIAGTID